MNRVQNPAFDPDQMQRLLESLLLNSPKAAAAALPLSGPGTPIRRGNATAKGVRTPAWPGFGFSVQQQFDYEEALRLQRQFDEEDELLRAQLEELQRKEDEGFDPEVFRLWDSIPPSPEPLPPVPVTFMCQVCFDDQRLEEVARITPCGHEFCRDCLRDYIVSRIDERRYPILCPSCQAGSGDEEAAVIDDEAIRVIGIPDEKYQIFEEMQLLEHSVSVLCRACKKESFVDRTEHQAAKTLTCPLPHCKYQWCKNCQQEIERFGPEHSCDGTNEFNHLFNQEGWKKCPGCETPVQRNEGCYHMICITPGCNTHFCYTCGGLIIKTDGSKNGVDAAVAAHYQANCVLFDVPPE